MSGNDGSDRLFGGGGKDTLEAFDGFADQIYCGPETDTAYVDPLDSFIDAGGVATTAAGAGCENVRSGAG